MELARDQLGEMQQKAGETWSLLTRGLAGLHVQGLPTLHAEQQALHAFKWTLPPRWLQWHVQMVAPVSLTAAVR